MRIIGRPNAGCDLENDSEVAAHVGMWTTDPGSENAKRGIVFVKAQEREQGLHINRDELLPRSGTLCRYPGVSESVDQPLIAKFQCHGLKPGVATHCFCFGKLPQVEILGNEIKVVFSCKRNGLYELSESAYIP